MRNLGLALLDTGKMDQALPLLEQAFKLNKAKLGPQHTSTLNIMRTLAVAYRDSGQLDHALPLFQELLKLNTAVRGPNDPETRLTTEGLVKTLRKAGKLEQAEAMLREQLAQPSGDVLNAKIELGRLLFEAAKTNGADSRRREELTREGERLVREYVAGVRSRYSNDPLALAGKLYDVAELPYRQGNYAEAEPLYREIVQYRRAGRKADHKDVLDATASLARLLSDWAWAERTNVVAADVRRLTSSGTQPSAPNLRTVDQSLVTSAATPHERAREAERLLREVLTVRLRDDTSSRRIGESKSRLGGALVSGAVTDPGLDAEGREAKLIEAELLLVEGCERVQSAATDDKYKRDALHRLVRLYEAWNKPDKRSEWQQKLELFDKAKTKSSGSESLIEGSSETKTETK
jgi:tetratricopeptide (TPR) repeat protein